MKVFCPRRRLVFSPFFQLLSLFQGVVDRICFVFCRCIHLYVHVSIVYLYNRIVRGLTVDTIKGVEPVLTNLTERYELSREHLGKATYIVFCSRRDDDYVSWADMLLHHGNCEKFH